MNGSSANRKLAHYPLPGPIVGGSSLKAEASPLGSDPTTRLLEASKIGYRVML